MSRPHKHWNNIGKNRLQGDDFTGGRVGRGARPGDYAHDQETAGSQCAAYGPRASALGARALAARVETLAQYGLEDESEAAL